MTRPVLALLVCLALTAAGCSDSNEAVVTGTVLVNGEPVKSGYIEFHPADGRGSVTGGPIVDGNYSANATIGTVIVKIRAPRGTGVTRRAYELDPNSTVTELTEESLPTKYNDESELRLEIKAGENKQDYPLKTE